MSRRTSSFSFRLTELPSYAWGGVALAVLILVSAIGYAVYSGGDSQPVAETDDSGGAGSQQATDSEDEDTDSKDEAAVTNTEDEEEAEVDVTSAEEKILTTEEIVAKSEASVAFIKGRMSSGTGFLIRPGILATNRHVIDEELMRHITVHFPSASEDDRGPYVANVLYVDDETDFALLTVDTTLPPLHSAEKYAFRRGQEILVIGNPGVSSDVVLKNAVSRGVMSTQTVIDGQQYNQLGLSINPGNSGGPVLDQSGHVIGVVTLKAAKKEGLGFSIPIQAVNAGLSKASSMPKDTIAKNQSIHRARAVLRRVAHIGTRYATAMGIYTRAMALGIDSGGSAEDGLDKIRDEMESKLASFDQDLIGDLKKELLSLSNDPHIPDSTRQRLVDLWTNFQELKSYTDEPRGSYNSYRAKSNELSDSHDRLTEALKLLLGVEE